MSINPRDTHFAGFAQLLFDELYATDDVWFDVAREGWKEHWQTIIAERAYDLVGHTIENTSHIDLDRLLTDEHVQRIPDMLSWPSEGCVLSSLFGYGAGIWGAWRKQEGRK